MLQACICSHFHHIVCSFRKSLKTHYQQYLNQIRVGGKTTQDLVLIKEIILTQRDLCGDTIFAMDMSLKSSTRNWHIHAPVHERGGGEGSHYCSIYRER